MLATIAAAASIVSAGTGILQGIFGASAQRQEARATAKALRAEKAHNLGVLRQAAVDQYWTDKMSQWRSGLSLAAGTSAAAIVENNQGVLASEIKFQEQQYDIKIGMANAAAGRRFLSIF